MKDDKKKSIIKEAISDYEEIMEAADVNAKQKLAKEFPEKFNNLFKDELEDKKKKSSYKKINENKTNEDKIDPVMKKGTKKTKKVNESIKEVQNEEFNITDLDMDQVDGALNSAGDEDEIITLDEIEDEINSMEDLDGEIDDVENLDEILKDFGNKLKGMVGGGIKSKIEKIDSSDDAGINKLMIDAFPILSNDKKKGHILKVMNATSPEAKLAILKQYAKHGGGTLRTPNNVLTYGSKEEQGKATPSGASQMQHDLGINEETGNIMESLKSDVEKIDPSDNAGMDKLLKRAFLILSNDRKSGHIKKVIARTSPEAKLAILKQYVKHGGGTLRTPNNVLTYGSKEEQAKTTPSGSSKMMHDLVGVGEGIEDDNEENIEIGDEEEIEVTDSEEEISDEESPSDEAVTDLMDVREKLDDIINNLNGDEEKAEDDSEIGDEIELGDEEGEVDLEAIGDEIDEMFTDNDVDALIDDEDIDEAHGVSHGSRKSSTGRNTPNSNYLSKGEKAQLAPQLRESKKKLNGLIGENKKITKQLNESKKFKKSVNKLVEGYKTALGKYRNQLKEMAIFNTNLAHVNNLFVNEELALTQEDKVKIINEFKKIDTIADSQDKYKTFLTEMKETEKTIKESIEDKITTSIQPSSKQKLDEVVEKTAYENNDHIKKMKRLIEYVENRGKKKII